jgi:hypothetical protein
VVTVVAEQHNQLEQQPGVDAILTRQQWGRGQTPQSPG